MRTLSAGGALVALAVLAGCAASPPPPITTIGELGAAYLDAGGQCDDLVEQYRESDDDPVVATCGADTELILAASADAALAVATERQLQEQTVLVFDRWVIRDPELETIQQELGGQIVTLAPADGPANMADAIAFDADGAIERDPVPAEGAPEPLPDAADVPDVLVVVDPACEYCDRLLEASGERLAELADAGRARVAYLPVSLGDSIGNGYASTLGANALACVADAEPEAYRPFQTALLAMLQRQPFDAASVTALAAEHGAEAGDCIAEGRFAWWVRQATVRAIEEPLQDVEPLRGVPTVVVDGVTFDGDVDDADALATFIAEGR
ncbi:thioredoxin domain-containing protein [Agrococcus sp. Marseille-Q4369]|uniref:DsbA family protein n=1 Tax=Agrococcus sp. Marseille-Q4369 TaxID=2810513 RepID=UPI001B8B1B4E|nr:thioredoxin domain-containing protein [Agrococcus sp. Marseille-Q4369]QUW19874.1 thioredoxin domain-containing protein [Agrococcus sp. Marseille-Q4369]